MKRKSCGSIGFSGNMPLSGFLLFCLWTVSACAPVPLDQNKPQSFSFTAPAEAPLKKAAGLVAAERNADHSTLIPLVEGNEALGARLRLIEQSAHSLDLQYFLMKPDLASALISEALLDAADRGVRVRYLVDDIFTTVQDEALAILDAHPNIEVRLFNPAFRPGPKSFGLAVEFGRVNRRMHNKMFVADGAIAIVGGRNIADEYYQIQTDSEFADFEILLLGPAIEGLEESYDLYWNDDWAVPISALHAVPSQEENKAWRADLLDRLRPARQIYEGAVNDPHFARLVSGQEPVYSAHIKVVTDNPQKLKNPPQGARGGPRILAEDLLMRMNSASKSVLLMTPYFVPEDYGSRLFQDLARRGVSVRIVTNSLASTNHSYVHAGYRRHRRDLLQAGVELHEIKSDALQAIGRLPVDDPKTLVMHTKIAIIDRDEVFVGSLNFDPRSVKLNTEVGVFVDSHSFGGFMHDEVERELRNFTYRLSLDENDDLLWHFEHPAAPEITTKEPGATFAKEIMIGLTSLLGVELQL